MSESSQEVCSNNKSYRSYAERFSLVCVTSTFDRKKQFCRRVKTEQPKLSVVCRGYQLYAELSRFPAGNGLRHNSYSAYSFGLWRDIVSLKDSAGTSVWNDALT